MPTASKPALSTSSCASGRPWTVRTAPLQSPFHLAEFSRRSVRSALDRSGWDLLELTVTGGRNPYPVPRALGTVIRVLESVDARIGTGLNITAVARRRA